MRTRDEGDGGWLGAVTDGIGDVGTGLWDAVGGAVDDVGEGISGAVDGVQHLISDPADWAGDTWNSVTGTATDTWHGLTTDPGGFLLDVLASDDAQQDWNNGDQLHAGAQVLGENLIGLIPYIGWDKKADRIADAADASRRDTPDDHGNNGGDNKDGADDDTGGHDEEQDSQEQQEQRAGGNPCANNSFLPGTAVRMADGSALPIEDVEAGQQVLATDPATGHSGPRTVTATITGNGTKHLVNITVTAPGANAEAGTVTATQDHPFWAPKHQTWIAAGDLDPGMWLRTSTGTWVQITALDTTTLAHQRVHNLTIADLHTYHVAVGAVDVLVHNSGSPCDNIPGGSLRANEDLGGHTIERHVGKTDEWLQRRAKNDAGARGRASSFTDRGTAARAIGKVLGDNEAAVQKWLADGSNQDSLPLKRQPAGGKVGRYVRADGGKYDARHVTVILRKDPNAPDGYRIHTAYPVKPSADKRR
ncbi:RNase A-like domain-containing protein [Salinactinospora qingdaonensis]|uniref:Bacterial CdiA-CT RNAse A domain-containing protein n=1 Tax=Salinactinospora qingdaonensis TaxID=702744 RepID=A0ABP7GH32_9ACTN